MVCTQVGANGSGDLSLHCKSTCYAIENTVCARSPGTGANGVAKAQDFKNACRARCNAPAYTITPGSCASGGKASDACSHCGRDEQPVCDPGMTTPFANPCQAICHGYRSYVPGTCGTNSSAGLGVIATPQPGTASTKPLLPCPADAMYYFTGPTAGRIKFGKRFKHASVMKTTLVNCAKLCIRSLSCLSFEFARGSGKCFMYVKGLRSGNIKIEPWVIFLLSFTIASAL